MDISVIGRIIVDRRKSLGITQGQLANLADVNINTIMKLERGSANPTLQIMARIADILGLELKLEVKRKQ